MLKFLRNHSGRQRGQALAEAAMILPVVLLAVLGLVNLGQAAYVANTAKNAAQYGARMGSVAQGNAVGLAVSAAQQQVAGAPGGGTYAVSVIAPGGERGTTLALRVHWSVPNYIQGLLGLLGAGAPARWEGDADAYFRQEGW